MNQRQELPFINILIIHINNINISFKNHNQHLSIHEMFGSCG